MLIKILTWLKSIQWDQDKLFDASSAHIGWAGFATVGFFCLGHIPFFWIWAGFVLYSVVKEYMVDLTIEKDETVYTSTVDFVTYQLGVFLGGIAILSVWLAFVLAVLLLIGMAMADYAGFFRYIKSL